MRASIVAGASHDVALKHIKESLEAVLGILGAIGLVSEVAQSSLDVLVQGARGKELCAALFIEALHQLPLEDTPAVF